MDTGGYFLRWKSYHISSFPSIVKFAVITYNYFMSPIRKAIIELVDNLVHLALFYGLLAVPMYLVNQDPQALLWLVLMVLPLLWNFFLRRVLKKFWFALPAHMVAPTIVVLVVPGLAPQVLWTVAVAILTLYSLGHYFRHQPSSGVWSIVLCASLFSALSIWAGRGDYWNLAAVYPPLIIIAVIGSVIVMAMMQMDQSLEAAGMSSAQPIKKIIKFNYKLMLGLSGTIFLLALLVFFVFTGPVSRFLSGMFPEVSLIRPVTEPTYFSMYQGRWEPLADLTGMLEEREPSAFALLMALILQVVFVAPGVIGSAILICLIVRAIFRWLSRRNRFYTQNLYDLGEGDEREFILPSVNTSRRMRRGPENPIRRLFRQTVTRHIKMGVPIRKSFTPTDIATRINTNDITSLVDEYVKVRYGEM